MPRRAGRVAVVCRIENLFPACAFNMNTWPCWIFCTWPDKGSEVAPCPVRPSCDSDGAWPLQKIAKSRAEKEVGSMVVRVSMNSTFGSRFIMHKKLQIHYTNSGRDGRVHWARTSPVEDAYAQPALHCAPRNSSRNWHFAPRTLKRSHIRVRNPWSATQGPRCMHPNTK